MRDVDQDAADDNWFERFRTRDVVIVGLIEPKDSGIHPFLSRNITLLTYSDIVLRFPLGASVPEKKLDSGRRECLSPGRCCTGYTITVREMERNRTGDFWLDSPNFYRQVDVSGWSFNALILLVDDKVVYTPYGGQPMIREQEVNRQPLVRRRIGATFCRAECIRNPGVGRAAHSARSSVSTRQAPPYQWHAPVPASIGAPPPTGMNCQL
jgi:hypothetical protein